VKRVGIVLHGARPEAAATAGRLAELLRAQSIEVVALESDAARVPGSTVTPVTEFSDDLDLVFVLGGDGTLLRAAEMVGPRGVPLLGVNFGGLGFLSAIERGDLESELVHILEGGFHVEDRMVLAGEIVDGERTTPVWAMNDVIIEKASIGRAIKLAVSIGGEPFVSIAADGIIIATPTGSTAYSFSAGGPVVSPKIDCLIVTPVSPHGLFRAPVIVPPDEEVLINVLPALDVGGLSADGQEAVALSANAQIRLRAQARGVRLATIDSTPFWRMVHRKFELPGGRR